MIPPEIPSATRSSTVALAPSSEALPLVPIIVYRIQQITIAQFPATAIPPPPTAIRPVPIPAALAVINPAERVASSIAEALLMPACGVSAAQPAA